MDSVLEVFLLSWAGTYFVMFAVVICVCVCPHCCREDRGLPARKLKPLLEKVTFTYPRRNSLPTSTSGGGEGGRPSTTAGTTAAAEDCVICLGQFEDGDQCSEMPICHHEFHKDCIANWLKRHNTCPLCRAKPQWSLVAQNRLPQDMV